jgi:hypothetical protein
MIENCYWPGGGKAGQFPPGFGKQGTRNTNTSMPSNTTANAATTTTDNPVVANTKPKVFALAAMVSDDPKVSFNCTSIPNPDTTTTRPPANTISDEGSQAGRMMGGHNTNLLNVPRVTNIITLLDSGASDHCIVQHKCFSNYYPIVSPRTGNSAGKGSTFNIEGSGTTKFFTKVNGVLSKLIISDCLHTPQLWSNLILVSKLISRGSRVTFEDDKAVVHNTAGLEVLTTIKRNGLYVVITDKISDPSIYAVQAKHRTVPYNIWHRRLGHISTDLILCMARD